MYNTALRIVNKVADAEDVLQESFTDAFLQIRDFQGRSTFGAWLKQIVVNKSINLLKKNTMELLDIDHHEFELADPDEQSASGMELNVEAVKRAVQALPDGYRAVITLYLFEGYDHEEIAEIMDVAQSTVRTQYIRAKQRLLQLLKKEDVYE